MDEFLSDRKLERETIAIINYFKLLRKGELVFKEQARNNCLSTDNFLLIGGYQDLERLILDCQNGDIDIFSNTICDLFLKLTANIEYMNRVSFSKNALTNKEIINFELIQKLYNNYHTKSSSAYEELLFIPIVQETVEEWIKTKEKTKKIEKR